MCGKAVGIVTKEEMWKKMGELAFDLEEIDKQLGGLYHLKKQKMEEIKQLKDMMVDAARNRRD